MDSDGHPTGPVLDGRYRAILIGDLVHPKNIQTYEKLTGREPFDSKNPEHLRSAARAQVRELQRLRHFVEASEGGVTILMGNHDASALNHKHVLGTATGLKLAMPGVGPACEKCTPLIRTSGNHLRSQSASSSGRRTPP